MEPQYDKIIVLLIVLTAAFLTWKMVKDFYITNTTKKDNWVKRAIFDIKHEKVKNEKNS